MKRGRQVNDFRVQGTISGEFPGISFCLVYPWVEDEENVNLETLTAGKKAPTNVCSLAKDEERGSLIGQNI